MPRAKARGRDAFFFEYNIKVCSVQRELVGGTREA